MSELPRTKLTVVGAGFVGMSCAHRAAQLDLASEIVVIDVTGG